MKTRNKIALLLGGVIVIFAVYLSFTINPVTGASLLVILPILFCPIACGGVGAIMWLAHRSEMKADLKKVDKRKSEGCC